MGINTGHRAAYHAWYNGGGQANFWQNPGPTRAFVQHMPAVRLAPRFEWHYAGDSKVFHVVKNSPGFPVPSSLDFATYQGLTHILSNPLDTSVPALNEHLVCYIKSSFGNAGLVHTFVDAELKRYPGAFVDPYPAPKAANPPAYAAWKTANLMALATPAPAPGAAAAAAAGGGAPPPAAPSARFAHHLMYKHAQSFQRHLQAADAQVSKPMVTRQQMTEVRGEFAAAKFAFLVLAKSTNDYHLKLGMNSPRVQGIDQIWVRRDAGGTVQEYVLVEAKGSRSAKLAHTATKGDQMSPQWAMQSLVELHDDPNGAGFTDANIGSLTTKIMKAMLGLPPDPRFPGHVPRVWGLVVHLMFANTSPSYMIRISDANEFNVDS